MRPFFTSLLLMTSCLQPVDVGYDDGTDGGSCGNVEVDIFQAKCGFAGCHSATAPVNGLDLVSPGVGERIRTSSSTCQGRPLTAFIPEKLSPAPTCGVQMPLGGPALSVQERSCIQAYLDGLMQVQPCGTQADHPLTDQQAICLGLQSPACAACHVRSGCGYFLRPSWAPQPPPSASFTLDAGTCGI